MAMTFVMKKEVVSRFESLPYFYNCIFGEYNYIETYSLVKSYVAINPLSNNIVASRGDPSDTKVEHKSAIAGRETAGMRQLPERVGRAERGKVGAGPESNGAGQ